MQGQKTEKACGFIRNSQIFLSKNTSQPFDHPVSKCLFAIKPDYKSLVV